MVIFMLYLEALPACDLALKELSLLPAEKFCLPCVSVKSPCITPKLLSSQQVVCNVSHRLTEMTSLFQKYDPLMSRTGCYASTTELFSIGLVVVCFICLHKP